ncbi:energy transducer TonB [Candidatus Methylacidiphilum infernorum]|uniref:Energy transducer TonB n=1 Tax=Candidatus Methylacidiphilum infernorum TaxID=511746 RepID=A0ABX7PWS3_9BACT|nr:energy transducer TonB [Candidatus Methylacidiphilum infernorum]QSR87456.1 energy transducer TonB [Candidatus Methylacidiphilum infernorum]
MRMEIKGIIGLVASLVFHFILLFGVGSLFYKKAEYAMGGAIGYSQVELVEGSSGKVDEPQAQSPILPQLQKEEIPKTEDFSLLEKKKEEPNPALAVTKPSANYGQGRTGKGKNTRTLVRGTASGGGGTTTAASPDYLHNPIPPYPEECRCRGQEGLVVLKVCVSPEGRPVSVQVTKSSGFPAMDRSALETVQRWKFNPAKMAGIPVTSYVIVPIRFKLLND